MPFLARTILIVAALLCAPATGSAQQKPQEQAGETGVSLVIGLSLPLSGNAAKLGKQFLAGAQMALADHNAQASIQARLAIADDSCSRDLAGLAAAEIADQVPAIVTGLLCNEAAYVFATAFRDSGIPVLVAGARSERIIGDRERKEWNVWRLSPGDNEAGRAAVNELSAAWAGRAYAIVEDGTVAGRTLADTFRAGMEEIGQPPQFQDNFRPGQSTQARLVRRLKKAGVTHVFIGASPEDTAMIVRNAAAIGVDLVIAGGAALDILPFLPEEDRPPAGLLAILERRGDALASAQDLAARLDEDDLLPDDQYFAGYAAIQVTLQAMQSAGPDADPAEVTENLATKTFETVLGQAKFKSNGANATSPFALYLWDGKTFQPIAQDRAGGVSQ